MPCLGLCSKEIISPTPNATNDKIAVQSLPYTSRAHRRMTVRDHSNSHFFAQQMGLSPHPTLIVPVVGRNQYGYITPPFSGSPLWERSTWRHHPCPLGSPWWGEINVVTSTLPSRGPIVGRDQYGCITPAFSGPHGGAKSIWLHQPSLLGVPLWGEINMATHPLPSWGPYGGEKST